MDIKRITKFPNRRDEMPGFVGKGRDINSKVLVVIEGFRKGIYSLFGLAITTDANDDINLIDFNFS